MCVLGQMARTFPHPGRQSAGDARGHVRVCAMCKGLKAKGMYKEVRGDVAAAFSSEAVKNASEVCLTCSQVHYQRLLGKPAPF